MNEKDKEIAIQLLIEKSERNLLQAKVNAQHSFWDLVVNRLYYSIFHAVTAMMLKDDIIAKSHKGTSQQFGKHYVITGKFSLDDGRLYNRLQSKREKADYNNIFILEEEERNELLEKTESLQKRIINYLTGSSTA